MKIGFGTSGITFNGNTIKEKGLGGSESALYFMALAMSKLGHEVKVYCECDKPGMYDGVEYLVGDNVEEFEGDVFFAYRFFNMGLAVKAPIKILVMHDMPVHPYSDGVKSNLWAYDSMFFMSNFHYMEWKQVLEFVERIAFVTSNGVDMALADQARTVEKEDILVWGSRPERGLDFLLEKVWPALQAKRPNLQLALARYDAAYPKELEPYMRRCQKLISGSTNIINSGALSKEEWFKLLAKSRLVVYPCRFPEIFCLVALESSACGTPIVTTNRWAFAETATKGGFTMSGDLDDKGFDAKFITAVEAMLDNQELYAEKVEGGLAYARSLDWSDLAVQWLVKVEQLQKEEAERKPPKISVRIITKNEELNIARCLQSVRDLADEIYVFDANSTDKTVLRAEESGAKVISITDDPDGDGLFNFAWARNESFKDVTTEWALWLDADEVLVNAPNIRKYLRSKVNDAFLIRQVNVTIGVKTQLSENPCRLFRMNAGPTFEGIIHETVRFARSAGDAIILDDVEIIHTGYLMGDTYNVKLKGRNLGLLEKERRSGISRPILPFYVMRDCLNLAMREIRLNGYTADAVDLLWRVVDEWKSRFAVLMRYSFSDSARDLAQTAMQQLFTSGNSKGQFHKFIVAIQSRDASTDAPMLREHWFTSQQEFLLYVKTSSDKALSEVQWN